MSYMLTSLFEEVIMRGQVEWRTTPRAWPKPKEKVVVRVLLDETVQILYRDKKLKYEPISQPAPRETEKLSPAIALAPTAQWKPAPDHPWRRFRVRRKAIAMDQT
jgi:hypothetical protein